MVKYGVKQSMSTVSKLRMGIQSPVDSGDYFICRLSYIGRHKRNGETFEKVSYNSDRRWEIGVSEYWIVNDHEEKDTNLECMKFYGCMYHSYMLTFEILFPFWSYCR